MLEGGGISLLVFGGKVLEECLCTFLFDYMWGDIQKAYFLIMGGNMIMYGGKCGIGSVYFIESFLSNRRSSFRNVFLICRGWTCWYSFFVDCVGWRGVCVLRYGQKGSEDLFVNVKNLIYDPIVYNLHQMCLLTICYAI